MNVLWICSLLFPEAAELIHNKSELKSSGGWMIGLAELLAKTNDVHLSVAMVSGKVSQLVELQGKSIRFFVLPKSQYEKYWAEIYDRIKPDVVHIHGTETRIGDSYVNVCGADNVVVSIQGLLSIYERYYFAGLSNRDVINCLTVRDMFKGGILQERKRFSKNAEYEISLLKKVRHVIGRTSWDKTHVRAINPNLKYHFCNEILRSEFYHAKKWSYDSCIPHTIFISQGSYPLKGLHQVLKALPTILERYPDTVVRIAGKDMLADSSFKDKLLRTSYSAYIRKLVHSLDLTDHVCFMGPLNANEMIKEYLSANVFVLPSSIENSPNSLGEAQLLGVPCVASYVGGVMDMIPNSSCGHMYRFEEIEMLTDLICSIFDLQCRICNEKKIEVAFSRHNPANNLLSLIGIYNSIVDEAGKY